MKQNVLLSVAKKLTVRSIALIFFFAIGLYGCSTTKIGSRVAADYNEQPLTVVIPAGLSPGIIHNAMISTVVRRRWVVQNHSANEVIANLKHRAFDATVTLQSDGSIIKILNSATHKNSQSGEIKPGVPLGWLINIQNDLQAKLVTAQLNAGFAE